MATNDPNVTTLDVIRHALEIARCRNYAELEIQLESDSFSATLSPRKRAAVAVPNDQSDPVIKRIAVKSQHVGYFRIPAGAPTVGQEVSAGSLLGVVSVLGLANDVEIPVSGILEEVCVTADEAVQFGQVLAWVSQL
jgi:biotin carboxyl carrier protein